MNELALLALIQFVILGTYFAGWIHGRGTAYWALRGHSSRVLRREIERREHYGEPP